MEKTELDGEKSDFNGKEKADEQAFDHLTPPLPYHFKAQIFSKFCLDFLS